MHCVYCHCSGINLLHVQSRCIISLANAGTALYVRGTNCGHSRLVLLFILDLATATTVWRRVLHIYFFFVR